MNDIEHLMKLADAVTPKPVTLSPMEVLPVICLLRDEKRLTWDEIRDWMDENAKLKRSHSFWATFYKHNSNALCRTAGACATIGTCEAGSK